MDARNDGESVGDLIAQGRVSVDGLVETSVLSLATLGAYNVDLPALLVQRSHRVSSAHHIHVFEIGPNTL